jgi:hypothetical protein
MISIFNKFLNFKIPKKNNQSHIVREFLKAMKVVVRLVTNNYAKIKIYQLI